MLVSRLMIGVAVLVVLTLMACSDRAGIITGQTNRPPSSSSSDTSSDDGRSDLRAGDSRIIWGPAPPTFPPGAQLAVLQGDPNKAGETFTVRLRFPNGYVLPPHFHPTLESVTVIRGTLLEGMGDDFSRDQLVPFYQSDFTTIPASTAHFATARGLTEVQVHAVGPFALIYVHPEDDPTRH
jgi:hypothetical protein